MIISYLNKDYIEVDESWLINNPERIEKKIHLVKLCFTSPDEDKIQEILNLLPFTNRFIINNGLHVKIYNDFFKKTVKKFYVENSHEDQWKIISFIRKNNKILLNFENFENEIIKRVFVNELFFDILKNVEIIKIKNTTFQMIQHKLEKWNGNVILV